MTHTLPKKESAHNNKAETTKSFLSHFSVRSLFPLILSTFLLSLMCLLLWRQLRCISLLFFGVQRAGELGKCESPVCRFCCFFFSLSLFHSSRHNDVFHASPYHANTSCRCIMQISTLSLHIHIHMSIEVMKMHYALLLFDAFHVWFHADRLVCCRQTGCVCVLKHTYWGICAHAPALDRFIADKMIGRTTNEKKTHNRINVSTNTLSDSISRNSTFLDEGDKNNQQQTYQREKRRSIAKRDARYRMIATIKKKDGKPIEKSKVRQSIRSEYVYINRKCSFTLHDRGSDVKRAKKKITFTYLQFSVFAAMQPKTHEYMMYFFQSMHQCYWKRSPSYAHSLHTRSYHRTHITARNHEKLMRAVVVGAAFLFETEYLSNDDEN